MPDRLSAVLQTLSPETAETGERELTDLIEAYSTALELWWGLALTQAWLQDEENAGICFDNFRTEINRAIDAALAVARVGESRLSADMFLRLESSVARMKEPTITAFHAVGLAGATLGHGDMVNAKKALELAYQSYRTVSPRPCADMASAMATSAVLAHDQGAFGKAVCRLRRALRWAGHDSAGHFLQARLNRDLGVLFSDLRRDTLAEHHLQAALELGHLVGDAHLVATVRTDLAECLQDQRRFAEALDLLGKVYETSDLPSSLGAEARLQGAACQLHLWRTLGDNRHYQDAKRLVEEAMELRTIGKPWFCADRELKLAGHLKLLTGDIAGAKQFITLALLLVGPYGAF